MNKTKPPGCREAFLLNVCEIPVFLWGKRAQSPLLVVIYTYYPRTGKTTAMTIAGMEPTPFFRINQHSWGKVKAHRG